MNIKLHNITCDSSVLDKTAYLNTTPADITAIFNSLIPQDLLNPVLIVDSTINPSNYNYVYITDLNAYYFITRCIILSNGRYELRLEKDVLFSNLTKIKNSHCIMHRSDTHGRLQLADPTDAFDEVESITITDLSQYKLSEFDVSGMDYLVIYYDGYRNDTNNHPESTFSVNLITAYDDGIEPSIQSGSYALETAYGTNINMRVLDYSQLQKLAQRIGSDAQLLSYIIGIYKIPMATSTTDNLKFRVKQLTYTSINVGIANIDLSTAVRCPYDLRSRWVFEDFTLFTTDVRKNTYYYRNPYRKYEIWCAFVGWVEIPASYIIDKNIKIFYTFDLLNGETTCNFYDVASKSVFMTKTANAFLQIPLSAMNMREMEERKTALILNTIIGTASSAVSIIGGAYTGNAVAVAGGVISAGKVATNAITGFTQLHPSGNVNVQNSNSGYQMRQNFILKETYKNINRIGTIGRPCNVSLYQISTETGYFEGSHLILSDNSGLCKDEIDKIKILIEKGCFAS